MSNKEEFHRLLDEILQGVDPTDAVACRKAHRRMKEIAEAQFADDININEFLYEAAHRLGQVPTHYPVMQGLIDVPSTAKLHLEYVEGIGPELSGNRDGLKYVAQLCDALAECDFEGEHIHLRRGEEPMVGDTFPLTISRGSDEWLEELEHEPVDDGSAEAPTIPTRDIDVSKIAAFVYNSTTPAPDDVQLTRGKIYKVYTIVRYEGKGAWAKIIRNDDYERMYIFEIVDDEGNALALAYDLDDTGIIYFGTADLIQVVEQ